MRVNIAIDSKGILDQLHELGQDKQGPYILSRTLNLLAKQIQADIKTDFQSFLKLRRSAWIKNQVRIKDGKWSTKTRLSLEIAITDDAAFLSGLDTGAERYPVLGRKYLAIPNPSVFRNLIIGGDNPLRVPNLALHSTPHGTAGLQRTFMIKSREGGKTYIMQRTAADERGSKARKAGTLRYMSGLRMLYTLSRTVHIPKKIHWHEVANSTVINNQAQISKKVIAQALKDTRAR